MGGPKNWYDEGMAYNRNPDEMYGGAQWGTRTSKGELLTPCKLMKPGPELLKKQVTVLALRMIDWVTPLDALSGRREEPCEKDLSSDANRGAFKEKDLGTFFSVVRKAIIKILARILLSVLDARRTVIWLILSVEGTVGMVEEELKHMIEKNWEWKVWKVSEDGYLAIFPIKEILEAFS
ncbi:hypothetical protein C2845_PMPSC056096 [Panicum miliaceum]|uniref:Uncharacterized protein n=1 Tax=Panicum miliaceum TaxID=4540 RepID=A0A3L6PBR9_PANMI|nr:hypothetical protein C2845_PMPSC056096 [Panicum miliaceum]